MWKIFQSSLPLVIAAGFEEAIVSTCRLIWYDEKAYAYRNLWYAIVFAFVTLPHNSVSALRTKSRYKSILVHYFDFLLSSMCYKVLNRFLPPHVLSIAPLYIYVLPVFGMLGMANVYWLLMAPSQYDALHVHNYSVTRNTSITSTRANISFLVKCAKHKGNTLS